MYEPFERFSQGTKRTSAASASIQEVSIYPLSLSMLSPPASATYRYQLRVLSGKAAPNVKARPRVLWFPFSSFPADTVGAIVAAGN